MTVIQPANTGLAASFQWTETGAELEQGGQGVTPVMQAALVYDNAAQEEEQAEAAATRIY